MKFTTEEIAAMAKDPSWVPQIHWHQWTQWSDPVQTGAAYKQQWRVCTHCNKAQFRTLRWDHQTSLHSVLEAIRAVRARGAKEAA